VSGIRPALCAAAFRAAASFAAATYVGYPVFIVLAAAVRKRPHLEGPPVGHVSVLIAAHNEAGVLREKLASVLADPCDGVTVEVVLADDGSTDGTAEVAGEFPAVRVERLERVGKAAALTRGLDLCSGDVIVFTDANGLLRPGTLHALLRPFADEEVGGVAGDQRYLGDAGSVGERAHWAFDRMMKEAESGVGSVVSATGALYAVRRDLVPPIPGDVTDDFYISTAVVAAGKRLVFAPDAVVTEWAASGPRSEYSRKVRVMTRGLRAVWLRRELLAPKHGVYALSLLSRKVARRLTAPAIVIAALASIAAPRRSRPAAATAAVSVTVAGLGAVGWFVEPRVARHPVIALPTFLCLSVVSALHALGNAIRGVRVTKWDVGRPDADMADTP
jgi:cellulose synthase/poly-beta-1,6-N-acetylglucosamine synthase-like glycosyltransferase